MKGRDDSPLMAHWVVRGGLAGARNLVNQYGPHTGTNPRIYGFSVQYDPGASVDDLALAGQFFNAQISHADEGAFPAALAPLGYSMRLVKTPGRGYHHTFAVLYDASGQMLQSLPADAARAISNTFTCMPNPHQARRRP